MSSSSKQPPSESLDGLKFGQKIYFEDGSLVSHAKPFGGGGAPSSSVMSKKGRGGGGGGSVQAAAQPPRCQVEGCRVDLSDAKAYYSRHKVCAFHSKSPTVIVAGLEQRFCQQCSRFHQLPEFDQGKRSCRRRLAGHNERRRKPQLSSSLTSRFARFSSPNFDNNDRNGGFLMEFSPYPKLSLRNAMPTPSDPSQTASSLTWQINSETHSDFFLQGGSRFHDPPPVLESYTTGVTDSTCALSLLSNETWGSSRNIAPPSVELNNNHNMVNFNGTLLPASSSHVAPIHQVPNPSWGLKCIDDSGNCSNGVVVPDLGLGQISQPIHHGHVPGELQLSQQGRRHFYMDMGQSRAYESPHWSL